MVLSAVKIFSLWILSFETAIEAFRLPNVNIRTSQPGLLPLQKSLPFSIHSHNRHNSHIIMQSISDSSSTKEEENVELDAKQVSSKKFVHIMQHSHPLWTRITNIVHL